MADPFRRLLARLDGGAVTLTAEERRDLGEDWEALASAGVVVETTSATTAECPACDEPHPVSVRVVTAAGLPTRWFGHCPHAGGVRFEPSELRRWVVRVPALGRVVNGRDGDEKLPGVVWRLGPLTSGAVERAAWLVAGWRGRTGLAEAVPELRSPNAVVFVPCHLPPASVWGTVPTPVVSLADVLRSDGTAVTLNRVALAAYLPPEPVAVVDGRPKLTLPPGTAWEDLTLVVEDHHLELVLGADRHRIGYEDLGLADGRTGGPHVAWWTLHTLAQVGELTDADDIATKSGTLKNNVTKVRNALKRWTGLADDPFHPVRRLEAYRPRFRIRPTTIKPM